MISYSLKQQHCSMRQFTYFLLFPQLHSLNGRIGWTEGESFEISTTLRFLLLLSGEEVSVIILQLFSGQKASHISSNNINTEPSSLYGHLNADKKPSRICNRFFVPPITVKLTSPSSWANEGKSHKRPSSVFVGRKRRNGMEWIVLFLPPFLSWLAGQ